MDFNLYQQKSKAVFKKHDHKLTEIEIALLDWAMGLGGESGEVLDLLKHSIFHKDKTLDKMEIAKELGDVLWYISAIAATLDIELSDVAQLNTAKLEHRHGSAYSTTSSANRHSLEVAFKDTPVYRVLNSRINKDGHAPVVVITIGPDGAGKTTITKDLANILDLEYIKCSNEQENKVDKAEEILSWHTNVILDRFYYPDDLIYSELKDLGGDISHSLSYSKVKEILSRSNVVFLYIYADLPTLQKRLTSRGDDYISSDELPALLEIYKDKLERLTLEGYNIIRIDTTKLEVDSIEYMDMLADVWGSISTLSKKYSIEGRGFYENK